MSEPFCLHGPGSCACPDPLPAWMETTHRPEPVAKADAPDDEDNDPLWAVVLHKLECLEEREEIATGRKAKQKREADRQLRRQVEAEKLEAEWEEMDRIRDRALREGGPYAQFFRD